MPNRLAVWLDDVETAREEFSGIYNAVDGLVSEALENMYGNINAIDDHPFDVEEDLAPAPFSEAAVSDELRL